MLKWIKSLRDVIVSEFRSDFEQAQLKCRIFAVSLLDSCRNSSGNLLIKESYSLIPFYLNSNQNPFPTNFSAQPDSWIGLVKVWNPVKKDIFWTIENQIFLNCIVSYKETFFRISLLEELLHLTRYVNWIGNSVEESKWKNMFGTFLFKPAWVDFEIVSNPVKKRLCIWQSRSVLQAFVSPMLFD